MKALVLLSGGLDSSLALKLVQDQGIEVEAINFFSPFCCCNKKNSCISEAKKITDRLGVKLRRVFTGEEYLDIVRNPEHGYGKNVNPCIDCRIFMYKKAKEYMEKINAKFIVTGEVVGQRPMSQHKHIFNLIEKKSGLKGLILRPLSAGILPKTIPENEGWVDRTKLFSISGRSRKEQMALAVEKNISDYPCPAGGCLLTDSNFARKIKDLIEHDELDLHSAQMLRIGRHFRINERSKLVVGRNQEENETLKKLAGSKYSYIRPLNVKGPSAVFCTKDSNVMIERPVLKLIASYCRVSDNGYEFEYGFLSSEKRKMMVKKKLDKKDIDKMYI